MFFLFLLLCVRCQRQAPLDVSNIPSVLDATTEYQVASTIVVSVNRTLAPASGLRSTIACFALPCFKVVSGASFDLSNVDLRFPDSLTGSLVEIDSAGDVTLRRLASSGSTWSTITLVSASAVGARTVAGRLLITDIGGNQTIGQVFVGLSGGALPQPYVRSLSFENLAVTCARACVDFRFGRSVPASVTFSNASLSLSSTASSSVAIVSITSGASSTGAATLDSLSFVRCDVRGQLLLGDSKAVIVRDSVMRDAAVSLQRVDRVELTGVVASLLSNRAFFDLGASADMSGAELIVNNLTVSSAVTSSRPVVFELSYHSEPFEATLRNVRATNTSYVLRWNMRAPAKARSIVVDDVRLSNSLLLSGTTQTANDGDISVSGVSIADTVLASAEDVISLSSAVGTLSVKNVTVNRCSMQQATLIRVGERCANDSEVAGVAVYNSALRGVLSLSSLSVSRAAFRVRDIVFVNSSAVQLLSCLTTRDLSISNVDVRTASFSEVMIATSTAQVLMDNVAVFDVSFSRYAILADLELASRVRFASVSTNTPLVYFENSATRGSTGFVLLSQWLFDNVTSTSSQFVVFNPDVRNVTVRDSTLRNCRMTQINGASDAALFYRKNSLSSTACTFEGLTVSGFAGNVLNVEASDVTLAGSSFDGLSGRALQVTWTGALNVRGVTVQNSGTSACLSQPFFISGTGGSSSAAVLSGVQMVDSGHSCAQGASSAVQLTTRNLAVADSTFARLALGSAVLSLFSTTVSVVRTVFDGNTAAAVALTEISCCITNRLNVSEAFFRNNSNSGSVGGAALRLTGVWQTVVTRCRFFDNRAASAGGGAVSQLSTGSNFTAIESVFRNNSAKTGGGAIEVGHDAVISRCDLVDNRIVDGLGSALRVTGNSGSLRLTNCTVQRNTVALAASMRRVDVGGVFVNSGVSLIVVGSCLCQNAANVTTANATSISCQSAQALSSMSSNITADGVDRCTLPAALNVSACRAEGCALRMPELHFAPSTPSPPITLPPVIGAQQQGSGSSSSSSSNSSTSGRPGVVVSTTVLQQSTNTTAFEVTFTDPDSDSGLPLPLLGAIVGGVAGALLLAALIGFGAWRLRKKSSSKGGKELTASKRDSVYMSGDVLNKETVATFADGPAFSLVAPEPVVYSGLGPMPTPMSTLGVRDYASGRMSEIVEK
jgi:predicted outer membrane repeat protein